MKKLLLFLFFIPFFIPLFSFAQLSDNFSDGDFTSNPHWSGDSTYFMVTAGQLQSNGPNVSGSIIYLSTPNTLIDETEWSFLVDLKFNPTATTFARIYLCSTSDNIKGSLDGYYIHLGNTSGDYITFYKQSGTTLTELFTGTTLLGTGNIKVRIKVTRDNTGTWKIFSDKTGGYNYVSEGSITDNTFTSTGFFGIYAEYSTASRYNLYYFDDFYVGPIIVDTLPPTVQTVSLSSPTQLDLTFSESVDQVTAETIGNYNVLGVGSPITASRDASDFSLLHLTFSGTFSEGIVYSLIVYNVQDQAGNAIVTDTVPFSFYNGDAFSVVINEIMADPDPAIGLPGKEYLELYNRTQIPINLSDWTLQYSQSYSPKTLPNITIPPEGYLIITQVNDTQSYSGYGVCVGLSSFSLTDDGAFVILRNKTGNIIHAVNYSSKWYNNTLKDEGGWSLEQIDPTNPCGEGGNWKASLDPRGGTPGMVNSVYGSNSDVNGPILKRASASRDSVKCVKIYFNEIINNPKYNNPVRYEVDFGRGNPQSIHLSSDLKSLSLYFPGEFHSDTIYTITVTDSIYDCAGNKISRGQSAQFSIPVFPDSADLVINEVLSDPKTGGVDFVEIYNRSGKVLDFADMNLLSLNDSVKITQGNFLSLPGTYTVLTTDPDIVKSQYYTSNPYNFIDMESFPSLNNDEGTIILTSTVDTVIDAMSYTSDMQFPLLNSTDGVSLERVSYDRPASDLTNWHSAAESVGFATPAYRNSQFMAYLEQNGSVITEPEVFSPDNDGYNDVLNITCKSDTPGKMLNIIIYDAKGRLIKYLVKNQLMSDENISSWDGTTEGKLKANVGIYVVYVEMLDLQGKVSRFKKSVVLATKL